MSSFPDLLYTEKNGREPQPTSALPLESSCVLPRNAASKFFARGNCSTTDAEWCVVSSCSSSPRDGPLGFLNTPPMFGQQASSNRLTRLPGSSRTMCCHSKPPFAGSVNVPPPAGPLPLSVQMMLP